MAAAGLDRLLYPVIIQIIIGHLLGVELEIGYAGSHASSRVLRPSASPLAAPDPVTTPGGGSQVGTGSANTTPTTTAAVLEWPDYHASISVSKMVAMTQNAVSGVGTQRTVSRASPSTCGGTPSITASPWVGVPSIRAAWLLQSPDGRSYLCILTSDGSVAWTLWTMPCG